MEYFSWPDRRSDSLFQAQNDFLWMTAFASRFPEGGLVAIGQWYKENGHKPWKDGAL